MIHAATKTVSPGPDGMPARLAIVARARLPIVARARLPVVALAILELLAALWGALSRLGWSIPAGSGLASVHGPIMVSGFLGTLISMERAVALQARWAYAAPLLSAVGAMVLMSGVAPAPAGVLIVLGSLGMVAIFLTIVRRQPALFTCTMALGAVAWFAGNVIWLAGLPIFRLVNWWAAFLILTIVGERLELSCLMRLSRTVETAYLLSVAVFTLGLVVDSVEGIFFPAAGSAIGIQIIGLGMVALALWLLRYDIARRTVRQTGLTRYIAVCLLPGFAWLGVGGVLRMLSPYVGVTNMYDAMLHAVFLGFVMSMIFGHAPIILPAVLGRPMTYFRSFYAHLILLHLSLLVRVACDLTGGAAVFVVWQWAGVFNIVAVLLFLFATARAVRSHPSPSGIASA
jgi:hypothetical protein